MRVALVVTDFPQLSETFIVSKAVGLLQRGVDIHVVCSASSQDQWDRFPDNHPVHAMRDRVHVAPPTRPRTAVGPAFGKALAELARSHPEGLATYLREGRVTLGGRRFRSLYLDAPLVRLQPDVVHFEFGTLALGRMYLRSLLRCAITVSFRGFDLNYAGLDDPDHFDEVWAHADGVHLLGQDLWRRAQARGAPSTIHHAIITPALDIDNYSPSNARAGLLGRTDAPVRVLSVGRLHWKKGYDYALEAVAELRRRDIAVEYRIVGGGDSLEAVAFWRHQLGLDDCVQIVGPVDPLGVRAHYEWADVLLHGAVSEGFCNSVIEAQACQVPVVCSDADGLSENVEDGTTGIVVARRDAIALADGIERFAREPELRRRAGEAGRRRVTECFRLQDQLTAFERFFQDAVVAVRG